MRQFYGRLENAFFLQEKNHVHIIFRFKGGYLGFLFGGGGESADFIFKGGGIFLSLNHFVLIEVYSDDILVACVRISTGLIGGGQTCNN